MQLQLLQIYTHLFQNLNVNKQCGQRAPHKAMMLISVMELVGEGVIDSNLVEFSEVLEDRFKRNWAKYVGESDIFKPNAGTPFWHLNYEPFWTLVPFIGGNERIEALKSTNPYSSSAIRQNIKYAVIDKQLLSLMQDTITREALIRTLLNTLS